MPVNTRHFRRNLRLRWQLFRALLRATRYSHWANIVAAFTLWFRFAKEPEPATFWQYYRRIKSGCRRCQVFRPAEGTCGSLNPADWPDGEESWGCGCHVYTKAKVKVTVCWLHEIGVSDAGWPAEEVGVKVGE